MFRFSIRLLEVTYTKKEACSYEVVANDFKNFVEAIFEGLEPVNEVLSMFEDGPLHQFMGNWMFEVKITNVEKINEGPIVIVSDLFDFGALVIGIESIIIMLITDLHDAFVFYDASDVVLPPSNKLNFPAESNLESILNSRKFCLEQYNLVRAGRTPEQVIEAITYYNLRTNEPDYVLAHYAEQMESDSFDWDEIYKTLDDKKDEEKE